MTIREALGLISTMDSRGNRPGSDRQSTGFNNEVANILRNVYGDIVERPNGANGYPSITAGGIHYQIKTARGNKPMWNESYVRPDSVLILNLNFGTVVVHGSLITTDELEKQLIEAKDYVAKMLRDKFKHLNNENFIVSGGRVQFADTIDWRNSRISFLNETINILEKILK